MVFGASLSSGLLLAIWMDLWVHGIFEGANEDYRENHGWGGKCILGKVSDVSQESTRLGKI